MTTKKTKRTTGRIAKLAIVSVFVLTATAVIVKANIVERGVVAGGGGISTNAGATLWSSVSQSATLKASNAGNNEWAGYIIQLPQDSNVDCQNGGVACAGAPTYYGLAAQTFTFRNLAGCATPACVFVRGATQYYRYKWTQNTGVDCTDAAINSGSSWSDNNFYCPGGTCTSLGTSITQNASTDGNYYFCVRSYNGGLIGTTQTLGPYQYDSQVTSLANVIATNQSFGAYVGGSFDLSAAATDNVSKLKDNSCEYICTGDSGLCNGVWRPASDNWDGTMAAGSCSQSSVTCTTNAAALTIQMRVKDNANNSATSGTSPATYYCDLAAPTCTISALTAGTANTYFPGAGTTMYYCNSALCTGAGNGNFSATIGSTDALSGVQKVNFPTTGGLTGCGDDASNPYTCSFSFTSGTSQNGSVTETTYDNVNNNTTCSYTLTQDNVAPTGGSISYTDGWYYDTSVPVSFVNPTDALSGMGTRIIQRDETTWVVGTGVCNAFPGTWGVTVSTNPGASPVTDATVVTGKCYKYRYNTYDNVTNQLILTTTSVAKVNTGGAFLRLTTLDNAGTSYGGMLGSADDPEGVVAPDNADTEIVLVQVVNEGGNVVTTGLSSTKSVSVTLGNLGTSGLYIAATNMGCAVGAGVTTCTGNVVAGEGYLRLKANGSEPNASGDAVSASATAAGLSGINGHNQVAYVIVRNNTHTLPVDVISATDVAAPDANQLIMNPMFSHGGSKIIFMSKVANVWNIYRKDWTGAAWSAATALTSSGLGLYAGGGFTWSGDDSYVVFSATNVADNEMELYAVKADGTDVAKTQAQLDAAGQKLTNSVYDDYYRRKWTDSDWSNPACSNGYQDRLVGILSHRALGRPMSTDLYMLSGAKTGGLYIESGGTPATITQLTDFPESPTFYNPIQPRWSHDCSKIVFTMIDSVSTQSKTAIYIMNITDVTAQWPTKVASFPVSTLAANGIYKIHDCTSSSCTVGSAVYPSFSADDSTVFFTADPVNSISMRGLQVDDITGTFYSGKNFDIYAQFVNNQNAYVYAPQKLGQSANNELSISQCAGAGCPNAAGGNPITYVSQSATRTGDLIIGTLDSESNVTNAGGLIFMNGEVAAVIPPGALNSETVLSATTPSMPAAGSCGGFSADCKDLLVSTGDARTMFPDGVIFSKDIQLMFHFCDTDGDGNLDVRQNAGCTGGTGGNTTTNKNSIYVYYWCDSNGDAAARHCTVNQWMQLNGSIDPVRNMITVSTNHFSLYDAKFAAREVLIGGYAPMYLSNPHTYPNPWRSGDGTMFFGIAADSTFTTTDINPAGGRLTVDVEIYDLRGTLVRRLSNTLTNLSNNDRSRDNGGLNLVGWDAKNGAGRPVASGVYMYHMVVADGWSTRGVTGKLAVVK